MTLVSDPGHTDSGDCPGETHRVSPSGAPAAAQRGSRQQHEKNRKHWEKSAFKRPTFDEPVNPWTQGVSRTPSRKHVESTPGTSRSKSLKTSSKKQPEEVHHQQQGKSQTAEVSAGRRAATRQWGGLACEPELLYRVKTAFKNKGEIERDKFSDPRKLTTFTTSRATLEETLKASFGRKDRTPGGNTAPHGSKWEPHRQV